MSFYSDVIYGHTRVFPKKGLDDAQIRLLLKHGFVELRENPFGKGRGKAYYVKPHDNESPRHFFFCKMLEEEIKKHTDKVRVYPYFRPDVVVYFPKKKICFEVETGKAVRSSKKRLVEKFTRIREEYDEVYILLLDSRLYWKYNKLGKVILRTQIKETIRKLFEQSI